MLDPEIEILKIKAGKMSAVNAKTDARWFKLQVQEAMKKTAQAQARHFSSLRSSVCNLQRAVLDPWRHEQVAV